MSSNSTRDTVLSLDKTEYLGASTRTHMPTVSPRLAEVYSVLPPSGEGEGPRNLDFDGWQGSNADLLDYSSRNVRETSHAYRVAKVKVFEIRRRRDENGQDLRGHHRSLKKRFLAGYEEEDLDLVALESPPSPRIADLREQSRDFVERARDPELPAKLRGPKTPTAALDFPALADEFEEKVNVYDQRNKELKEAEKQRDEALAAKRAAKELNKRIYTNVARIQEGLYRLAGLDELADRIRITIPVRSSKPATDTPAPDGEPADPPPADPPQPEPPAQSALPQDSAA